MNRRRGRAGVVGAVLVLGGADAGGRLVPGTGASPGSKVEPPSRNSPDEPIAASACRWPGRPSSSTPWRWTGRARGNAGRATPTTPTCWRGPPCGSSKGRRWPRSASSSRGGSPTGTTPTPSSKPRWDTEVVATASALAIHDAATTGTLHPTTRKALDRMWTLAEARRGVGLAQVRLAPLRVRRLLRRPLRRPGRGLRPRWLCPDRGGPPGPRAAARLLSGQRTAQPASRGLSALGLAEARWPDDPGPEGEDGRTTARPPATRRRLEPPLAGANGIAAMARPTTRTPRAMDMRPASSSSSSARRASRPRTSRSGAASPGSRHTSVPRADGSRGR